MAADASLSYATGSQLVLSGNVFTSPALVMEPSAFQVVVVPYWALVLLSALLPLYVMSRLPGVLRRRRRLKRRLCVECGYDLRASKDRCPECGAVILPPVGNPGEGKPLCSG